MKVRDNDTIAAIATPVGEGAIAVIRVSGPGALSIGDRIFQGSRISDSPGYRIHFGRLIDAKNGTVDQVLVSVFRSPHSYTGEDALEISCHGGMFLAQRILGVVIDAGARQADPGEFTKRAFLNGKMDLSQAEAVADLIAAKSEGAQRVSMRLLEGALKQEVGRIKSGLIKLCSLLELDLDFAEEGLQLIPKSQVEGGIDESLKAIGYLVGSYSQGRILRDGLSVAIVGRPNVGKSSLFNALLGTDRAIISPSPGTTRDFLEESLLIDGLLVTLRDTAGLRDTSDLVESEGVRRSKEAARRSDAVVFVFDGDQTPEETRRDLLEVRSTTGPPNVIPVSNKADLPRSGCPAVPDAIQTSAVTGEGLQELRTAIWRISSAAGSDVQYGAQVTNRRHYDCLVRATHFLELSRDSLSKGATNEFIALDVRSSVAALAEITGEITTEEILNNIFERFCIGK